MAKKKTSRKKAHSRKSSAPRFLDEPLPSAGAGKPLPKRVYLIWTPEHGFYEPPFDDAKQADKFARVEVEDMSGDTEITVAVVPATIGTPRYFRG